MAFIFSAHSAVTVLFGNLNDFFVIPLTLLSSYLAHPLVGKKVLSEKSSLGHTKRFSASSFCQAVSLLSKSVFASLMYCSPSSFRVALVFTPSSHPR